MASHFPLDEAQLVALFMEAVLYGVYLVTFFSCIRVLVWSSRNCAFRSPSDINYKMIIAALIMLVFATMDIGVGLLYNLEAFIYTGLDPKAHFADSDYWVNVVKMVTYVGQTFVGDTILIYRCFIVWNRRHLMIAAPTLLFLGGTVCGIMTVITLSNNVGALNSQPVVPFISSMLSLTLATNLLTTGLIIYRIWSIRNVFDRTPTFAVSNNPLHTVERVLLESGLMYTISIVVLFACYLTSSNSQLAVSDAVVQIIGITFNVVLLRVDRERLRGDKAQSLYGSTSCGPGRYVSSHSPATIGGHALEPTMDVDLELSNQPTRPRQTYIVNIEKTVIRHNGVGSISTIADEQESR